MADACDCCSEPPCSYPTLEFISSSGSCVIDCAFWDGDTLTNYAVSTVPLGHGLQTIRTARKLGPEESFPAVMDPEDPETELLPALGPGDCVYDWVCSGSYTTEENITFTKWEGVECEDAAGTYSTSITETWSGTGTYDEAGNLRGGDGCASSYTGSGSSTSEPGGCSNTATVDPITGELIWDGGKSCVKQTHWVPNFPFGGYYNCLHDVSETTYTPPYGDAVTTYSGPLYDCDITLPVYPAWPNEEPTPYIAGQGSGSSAYFRFFDYGTIGKRKIKYRVSHEPPGTCYLKVWMKKTTTPMHPATGSPVEDEVTYEWVGTGNPCLPDPDKIYYAAENRVYSDPVEILVPETHSEVTISIVKYSCLPDYVPDISDPLNPQPNGYPSLTWEASPP